VLKFGGTSVAGRPQWDVICDLARRRRAEGFRVLLVCSAVAGVTNRLAALADQGLPDADTSLPGAGTSLPGAGTSLAELIELHRGLGRALGVDDRHWLPRAMTMLEECLATLQRDPGPPASATLLAAGEWLSTHIGCHFLRRQGLETDWVDAREALEASAEPELSPARQWLSASCAAGPDPALAALWSGMALLAGRLQANRVEIWTDVPGLFSADPRLVPQARLLGEVDYAEALEMAASGAKVVHPRSIRAAADTQTPVLVGDVNRPALAGTRIGACGDACIGVKTVTCQQDMAVMLLQNRDARRQVGFLADVFEVFRRHGVSIDLVATSETTTTVSLNKEANHLSGTGLDELERDLGQHCTVQRFDDCVCVNLVGRGARTALSRLAPVMRHFDERPLLMVSQSANDLCLSLLVPAGEHRELLRAAHAALIPDREDGVFGATWAEISRLTRSEEAAPR
jgi:diaminopimelate decarboxylase/aspartate kinase